MKQKGHHSCEGFRHGQKHISWHSSVHCWTMLPPLNLHLPHNLLYIIAEGVGRANFQNTDNDLLNRKACYHYSKRWSLDIGHDFWWFRQAKNILKALSLDQVSQDEWRPCESLSDICDPRCWTSVTMIVAVLSFHSFCSAFQGMFYWKSSSIQARWCTPCHDT